MFRYLSLTEIDPSYIALTRCCAMRAMKQVSAVTREGFDDLLETLLLQAEVLQLRADDKVRGVANVCWNFHKDDNVFLSGIPFFWGPVCLRRSSINSAIINTIAKTHLAGPLPATSREDQLSFTDRPFLASLPFPSYCAPDTDGCAAPLSPRSIVRLLVCCISAAHLYLLLPCSAS